VSPRLAGGEARRRFGDAQVARLATVRPDGGPHVVPVTFALLAPSEQRALGAIVVVVDHKPKSTLHLQRLANIAAEPRASFLVDAYDDDWDALWWVRADARARVLTAEDASDPAGAAERTEALAALAARYPQYRERPPTGPVIWSDVERWSSWSAC
jgi:PPOX class probable F420-dependent enzyme